MKCVFPAAVLLAMPAALFAADPAPLSPAEIVAQSAAADWTTIPAQDLLVMDLAPDAGGPDAGGKARRVVIQLMPPPFAQGWIGNIRKLAATHWWDSTSVNRVQDNYVVQWGDGDAEVSGKAKPLPAGLKVVPQDEYTVDIRAFFEPMINGPRHSMGWQPSLGIDSYNAVAHLAAGWSIAEEQERVWPIHCYGMVGVGRAMPPDTGSGAELYAVIGTPPRHLDRNIALVGRVIEGIEHLSTLPRGTGPLGFYEKAEDRVPIRAIRLGTEIPGLPTYQYLSTESASFARYADARANRRDPFFIQPAGGADICNIPVPVRRAP